MHSSIRGMAVAGAVVASTLAPALPAAHATPAVAPAAATVAVGARSASAVPAMTTSTAMTTTSTSTAARRGVTRDQKWERALFKELNTYRAKKKMRRVGLSSCLSKAVQPLAAGSAKAGRAIARTKADRRLLAACAPRGKRIDAQLVWGPSRSVASVAAAAARVGNGKFYDRRQTQAGVAAYRDARGRMWVAMVQTYTH